MQGSLRVEVMAPQATSGSRPDRCPLKEVSSDEGRMVNTNLSPDEVEIIKEIRLSRKPAEAKKET